MIRNARAVLLILASTILSTVGTTVDAQDTIPRELRRAYPEDRFLVRSGTGDNAGAAAEAARLEIAKYFESKITGETVVKQWAGSRSSRGKISEDRFTELTNTIIISTSRDIPGIELPLTEEIVKSKEYRVWAVLEKVRFIKTLKERMEQLDRETASRMATLPQDDLGRIRALRAVLAGLLSREQARQDLTLLETTTTIPADPAVLFSVMNQLDTMIAESFDVALVFSQNVDPKVRAGILKGITDAGIRIREYAGIDAAVAAKVDLIITADHTVTSRTSSTTVNNRAFTFYFANGVLSVATMDPKSRAVISNLVLNDEGNGSSDAQAVERLVKKVLDTRVPVLTGWVYETIFKQAD
jgi:hypothetical protein